MACYANSRFKKSVNEWGRVEGWIEPGDKVTQSDLGVNDDEWKALLESGVVVENYPEGLRNDPQTPPVEYYRTHSDDDVTADDNVDTDTAEDTQQDATPTTPTWQTPQQSAK